jgi:hypothetical protein
LGIKSILYSNCDFEGHASNVGYRTIVPSHVANKRQ